MEGKSKIKIVKRGEQVIKEPAVEIKSVKETARDMASTVSGWVSEFQQKRREETKQALQQLFGDTPNPTGANC